MQKQVILTFNISTGETSVETKGFTDDSCKSSYEFIKKALGDPKDLERKAEWFNKAVGDINTNRCG